MAFRYDMFGASHKGHVRTRNEDSWWTDPTAGLAVVADGMGGHPAGADASAVAVRAFVDAVGSDTVASGPDRGGTMAQGVIAAHQGIRSAVDVEPTHEGMGTTLTAARLCPSGRMMFAHVGDSRLYRLRSGELRAITRDHTWVAEAVETGQIAPSAAATHPMSHVLTQAVGIDAAPEPDVGEDDVRDGDLLLLCSDGLTGPVADDEIRSVLCEALGDDSLDEAPARLIAAALTRGGPDNITAVVIRAVGSSNGASTSTDHPDPVG
ncbi:MAG: protein phosphatase 2C domain-containing protein [Gemmatimonadetes bacterium]|nr:protein phosphatase 2C domain-containing protein [Gemmatimonadota bacterium]NNK62784.1 serine/threonine-protein phosphatase [Gemmatimonadota bacterium]